MNRFTSIPAASIDRVATGPALAIIFVSLLVGCDRDAFQPELERESVKDTTALVPDSALVRGNVWNGHRLTNLLDARSGVVKLTIGKGNGSYSGCTGTVLKSSQITDDSWILTAAHCFYDIDDIMGVHDVGSTFDVSVSYGADLELEQPVSAEVTIHPDWASHVNGWFSIWYDQPDIALMRVRPRIPVLNEYGREYVEYARPIFDGTMSEYAGTDVAAFGSVGGIRWARGKFTQSSKGYIVIDDTDMRTKQAAIEHGDSGGPWLYTTGGETPSQDYVLNGVVIGVTSGAFIDGNLMPWKNGVGFVGVDYFAMGLSHGWSTPFILSTSDRLNADLATVDKLPWNRQPTLRYVASGTTSWTHLEHTSRNTGGVFVADFGPDPTAGPCDAGRQIDDVFLAENGRWFISWCGTKPWRSVRSSDTETEDKYRLAFGDFNGDGVTDVFRASEGAWKVSYSATGPWTTIKSTSTELTDGYGLAFGDFNGDGRTDVFRASGGTWKVSHSGSGPWTTIKQSNTELMDSYGLAFGDFNGDGATDVFRASGGTWKVSYSASGPWTTLKSSDTQLTDSYGLVLGYFDADNKVDVLRANGSAWLLSSGGVGPWTTLMSSQTTSRRLAAGDLNGDRVSDFVLVRDPFTCTGPYNINVCSYFYYFNNTAPTR